MAGVAYSERNTLARSMRTACRGVRTAKLEPVS
jgi:hypothetical protein